MSTSPQHDTSPEYTERAPELGRHPSVRFLMQVLWPAFLGAVLTVGVIFSLIDPLGIETAAPAWFGESREAAYTVGFLGFWALHCLACTLTWMLGGSGRQRERPAPNREGTRGA